MAPTLPSIDYSGGIMKSFDTPSFLPAKNPIAIPKAITPSPEPSVYEDKGWADQYRQDLKDFYQGTDVNNPMTSGLYQTLAPHEATIENLGQTTQETAQRSKELGKNITSGAQQLGDIIQGAPDVEGAKKQGKYLSQDELNTKISGLMEAMPDATDEEIATALKQMQDEGHIFEGINDKQGMVDVASQGGLAPYRQALGGAVKAFGSGVGGLTSGYGSAMEGAGNIGAGDTNLGVSQVAKGAGETAGGVLTGAFPVASTIMNTSAFQATPLQAGLEKFGEGANYVAGKGVELAGGDLSTETGENYQQAGSTAIQLGAIPLGIKGLKVAGKALPGVTSSVGEMAGKVGETVIPIANKAGEMAKKVLPEKNPISGVKEGITRTLPEKTIENDLGLTPTERGKVEQITGMSPAKYVLDKNIANLSKEQQAGYFEKQAQDSFDSVNKQLEPVSTKIKSEEANSAISDMMDQMSRNDKVKSMFKDDIQYLGDLLKKGESEGYSLVEMNNIRRAFDKVNTGLYTARGEARSGLENMADQHIRNAISDSIQENALKSGVDVRALNSEVRAGLVMKDALLRRLSQEQRNNLVGLQDLGIMGIFSGGNPATALALGIGKKWYEGVLPSVSQKLYNLSSKPSEKSTLNRGNTISTGNRANIIARPNTMDSGSPISIPKEPIKSTIPGSSKTTIEVPSNPTGNLSKTLAGKQGVMVEPKQEIKLLPSGEKYKQSQVKTIEQELNTALQSKYNPNKPEATKKFIDSAIEQGKISKEQGIAIVQKLYENANGFDKPHYEKIIKEISSGKSTSFEDLINEKPTIPTAKEQTPREMFDKLNQMANDGRYGEKSWNDLADKFKQKTGKDIMDTGHDDFAPDGSIKTPPTTLPKSKESVAVPESKKSLPISEKEAKESKPVLPTKKTTENLTPNKESATMGDMETNKILKESIKYNTFEEFGKNTNKIPLQGIQKKAFQSALSLSKTKEGFDDLVLLTIRTGKANTISYNDGYSIIGKIIDKYKGLDPSNIKTLYKTDNGENFNILDIKSKLKEIYEQSKPKTRSKNK